MSRRRAFDVAPAAADGQGPDFPMGKSALPRRPGPMAAALRENADSLRRRAALEEAARNENDALAAEYVRLRDEGLVAARVPLERIDADALIRDRATEAAEGMDELVASIHAVGLSNPIRVAPRPDGRFALIQGWRRLQAYRRLLAETGDRAWAAIPAAHAPAGQGTAQQELAANYRRMVDENLVREGISFAEMAALARAYAADPATDVDDADAAVSALYASAGPQKRSYIRAFVRLLARIGDALTTPQALPRNLGLDIRAALEADPGCEARLRAALAAEPGRDAAREQAILRAALRAPPSPRAGRRTMLRLEVKAGAATLRCAARAGRVTLQAPLDFAEDPVRLRAALAAFAAALQA